MQEYTLKEYKVQIPTSKIFSVANLLSVRKVGNKDKGVAWKRQRHLILTTWKKPHLWGMNISKELQFSNNQVINNFVSHLKIDGGIPWAMSWLILRCSLPV